MSRGADISDLVDFIDKYQPGASLESEDRRSIFKRPYRQYNALLVWGLLANEELLEGSDAEIYFREFVSECAHALLLTLFNFYKPARMALRSSAENFARFLTISENSLVQNDKSTYELLDAARLASDKYPGMRAEMEKVCSIYSELCLTVHSAKPDYMALKIPFNELTIFDPALFGSNLHIFLRLVSALNKSMFFYWGSKLSVLSHVNADIVRDALPASIKRQYYEAF